MKQHRPIDVPSRVLRGALCHAAIALACILVYGQTLRFGLTRFEDYLLLEAVTERPVSLTDVFTKDAFLQKNGSLFYRPLQTLTYLADVQFGGKDAYGCHGTNLLLYVLTCCALFSLLRRLGHGHGIALVSGLVYSLNPLFTQVVAWIPARGDLLLALFAMVSFIALIRFRETRKWHFLVFHWVAFFLAELSKETAVMLPAVFAVHIVFEDGAKKLLNRQNAGFLFSWVLLAGAYLVLRRGAISGVPETDAFGIRLFLGNLATIPETLSSFVWPVHLSLMPSFSAFRTITGLILIAAVAVRVAMQREKRWAPIVLGAAWFLILSAPGMFFRPEGGIHAYSYLNHRMFLPMVGAWIVAVELVPMTWCAWRPWMLCGGVVLAGVLALLSFRQSRFFAEPRGFYDQAVLTNPQSALALLNRGCLRQDNGDIRGAVEDYSRALQIVPDYLPAHFYRGTAMGKLGDYPAALADLTAAIREATLSAMNRAHDQAAQSNPPLALALYNRGRIRQDNGDLPGAIEDYNWALQVVPDEFSALIILNRGLALAKLGDAEGALQDFETAWERDPRLPEPLFRIGLIKHERKDEAGARAAWQTAAALGHQGAQEMLRQHVP
ncbi:MAG: tetratricopeptide repeat protein [Lentisphaerae bacterium]|nr:tetratricopeptide repeat protein [Lentisphaerota bacterium]